MTSDVSSTGAPDLLASEELKRDIQQLEGRDLQLWAVITAVLFALAAGFLTLAAVYYVWPFEATAAAPRHVPQLFIGLIALLLLLNVYLFDQKLGLQKTRHELIQRLRVTERLANNDALTGVYNRRYMETALAKELSRSERTKSNLCIMVVDIDGFKSFNTRFGHTTGDSVLTEVARLLQRNFRAADSVVRYGGDEFLVIMPETDFSQATIAVRRLHGFLQQWNEKYGSVRGYTISLSAGTAQYQPGETVDDFIHNADLNMYAQKERQDQSVGI
jgi:diguanylate cyclase (GGDEF)-like protein